MGEPLRIGLTMRVMQAPGYDEPRDALAQNWAAFLQAAFPQGAAWLPVPNLGAAAVRSYCEAWDLNRLILTGGEDPGVAPLRDETERALLAWARERRLPVLGVCRGMQMMTLAAGGALKPVAGHVRTRHALQGPLAGEANSFHAFSPAGCPPAYRVLASAEDGEIEAIGHERLPWFGWMWHPEREPSPRAADLARLREIFR
jgi:putative glutamine amidotransferase